MIYFVAIIYMFLNVITDFFKGITKNWWHLCFVAFLSFYVLRDSIEWGSVFISGITALFIAFVFRKKMLSYGSGDIKMLFLLSIFVALYFQSFVYFLIWLLTYLCFSVLHISIARIIYKLKGMYIFYTYEVDQEKTKVPEAVPFFLAVISFALI